MEDGLEDGPPERDQWYPTRFVRPPLWRLGLVILVELALGVVAVVVFHRQWIPTGVLLVGLFALAVWQWRGSARPDLSQEPARHPSGSGFSEP